MKMKNNCGLKNNIRVVISGVNESYNAMNKTASIETGYDFCCSWLKYSFAFIE